MQLPAVRPGVAIAAVAACSAVVLTLANGCSADHDAAPAAPATSIATSTTQVAGAGVLGNQRRPDESCAAEPAAADSGADSIRVDSGTDRGEVDVPADPQRIVAMSVDQLDALCALGLQSRIVGAATASPGGDQPSYLGTVVHDLPKLGPREDPDRAAIAEEHPDLILGSTAQPGASYADLAAIAPTVFTGSPGADWQLTLRTVGIATGRADAAEALIREFTEQAAQAGIANDATHFQASIVQLTEDGVRVFGTDNFPATVLAAIGVDRPADQRFSDAPYTEIGVGGGQLATADLSAADGDIVYVSFSSRAAKDHAPQILDSHSWRKLSAARDNRVFIVNNEVWHSGAGLVAARGMLDDLRWLNAPIN